MMPAGKRQHEQQREKKQLGSELEHGMVVWWHRQGPLSSSKSKSTT